MDSGFLVGLLAAAIRIATPLIMGALGGLISERAGVFAVGIEGMMLAGCFGAAVGTFITGSVFVGLAAAIVAGALVATLAAVAVTRFRADQMVTGLAINILVFGLTGFLIRGLFGGRPPAIRIELLGALSIPFLSHLPVIGPILFRQPILTYAAVVFTVALHFFLHRTRYGLSLRATGENPEAVYAAGNNPVRIRLWCRRRTRWCSTGLRRCGHVHRWDDGRSRIPCVIGIDRRQMDPARSAIIVSHFWSGKRTGGSASGNRSPSQFVRHSNGAVPHCTDRAHRAGPRDAHATSDWPRL